MLDCTVVQHEGGFSVRLVDRHVRVLSLYLVVQSFNRLDCGWGYKASVDYERAVARGEGRSVGGREFCRADT